VITSEHLIGLLPQLEQDRIEKTISPNNTRKFGEAISSFANNLSNHNLPGYLLVVGHENGVLAGMTIDEPQLQILLSFRTDCRLAPPPAMTVAK